MPAPPDARRFEKWRTPKRRNAMLLLVAALAMLVAAFAFDNAGVSKSRDEPTKGDIDESAK